MGLRGTYGFRVGNNSGNVKYLAREIIGLPSIGMFSQTKPGDVRVSPPRLGTKARANLKFRGAAINPRDP